MKASLIVQLFAAMLISFSAGATTIYGTGSMLNGYPVTTFADVNGQLNSVGFQVSGGAIRDPGTQHEVLFFTLPMEASGTGFKVLQFDWNPQGHEPPGVYDLPHFDFHFYYISDAERLAIPANETYPVAPQFLPAAYSQPGPTVPEMGGHALDLTGPEFNGGVFGQTFIYGYNRGQEIFLEPMLTKAYLEALSSVARFNIRQPSQYTISTLPALVPTTGEYAYDSATDTYTIRVGDFVSLVAVPEPGTLFLSVLCIPAMLLLSSRRRKRN